MVPSTVDAITRRIYDKADAALKANIQQRAAAYHKHWYPSKELCERFRKLVIAYANPLVAYDEILFEIERDGNREKAVERFMSAVEVVSSECDGG
jgi:hypothetical protein